MMKAVAHLLDVVKALLTRVWDDVLSLLLAVVSSLIPAWWFSKIRLPFPWYPSWTTSEWMIVMICVFFVLRLWRTLRKAAL